jgi:SsrA-binding protein
MSDKSPNRKFLLKNKKAFYNFEVLEKLECGISLQGTEVKSIKSGRMSFSDSYCRIREGELFLIGFHISQYPLGNINNHDPDRERKLLVHKQEIKRLKRKVLEKGLTLVPLSVYLKRGMVKIEVGLCRGKKLYDKREDIKRRDLKRDADRELRHRL